MAKGSFYHVFDLIGDTAPELSITNQRTIENISKLFKDIMAEHKAAGAQKAANERTLKMREAWMNKFAEAKKEAERSAANFKAPDYSDVMLTSEGQKKLDMLRAKLEEKEEENKRLQELLDDTDKQLINVCHRSNTKGKTIVDLEIEVNRLKSCVDYWRRKFYDLTSGAGSKDVHIKDANRTIQLQNKKIDWWIERFYTAIDESSQKTKQIKNLLVDLACKTEDLDTSKEENESLSKSNLHLHDLLREKTVANIANHTQIKELQTMISQYTQLTSPFIMYTPFVPKAKAKTKKVRIAPCWGRRVGGK